MNKIILSIITIATMATVTMANEIENKNEAEDKNEFLDRFHAKGDLRLRYESIEREDYDTVIDDKNKYRARYRLRYNLDVDITDALMLESAISSGKGNPTSGNVTIKDDENIKDYFFEVIKIDIVDLVYKFDNNWLRAGKSKHHIYRPIKTQLIWDNDIRFEGVNYGYKDDTKNFRLGVNRVHRLKEGSDSTGDIYMYIAQYVQTMKLDTAKINMGAGFYYYDGVKGNSSAYGKFKGNTKDANGLYANNYNILEGFSELKLKDIFGKPFKVAATVAYNTAASNDNFGYDISMQLGDTKKVDDWKVGYTYRDVQKDAVFGAHNDSDFIDGGTDGKGHILTGKYKFAKNVDFGAYFQWAQLGEDKSSINGMKPDFNRMQLDVILKF